MSNKPCTWGYPPEARELVLEAGADDIQAESDTFEVTCDPECYTDVSDALEGAGIEISSKQVTRLPQNTVTLNQDDARQILKLLEELDDHDDVQNVSANFDIPDDVLAAISTE